jgi:hypothetical protein
MELLPDNLGQNWPSRVETLGSSARRLTLRDGADIQQRPLLSATDASTAR